VKAKVHTNALTIAIQKGCPIKSLLDGFQVLALIKAIGIEFKGVLPIFVVMVYVIHVWRNKTAFGNGDTGKDSIFSDETREALRSRST
jgi:hypothetical protein